MAGDPPKSPEPPPPPCGDPPGICGDPELPRGGPPKPPRRPPARTRLRNRRYAALRELLREGEYFSEERMRLRAPALFHHYIGRFREPKTPPGPPKIHPGDPKIHPGPPQIHPGPPKIPGDPKTPPGDPKSPAGPPPSLRELLLSSLEDAPEDEDEEEEEDEDEDEEDEERIPDEAERELLRLEFTTRMYQRFLEGQDSDFDYREVDENPELDNLDIVSRDLEDRYFDEEEPGQAPPLQ